MKKKMLTVVYLDWVRMPLGIIDKAGDSSKNESRIMYNGNVCSIARRLFIYNVCIPIANLH
jgi:hypothetical protein